MAREFTVIIERDMEKSEAHLRSTTLMLSMCADW